MFTIGLVTVASIWPSRLNADSELGMLLGFDSERIAKTYPVKDVASAGEMAKLLYRLDRLPIEKIEQIADLDQGQMTISVSDALRIKGKIEEISLITVPEKLVEFLEMERFVRLQIASEDSDDRSAVEVFTSRLPSDAVVGDRVRGVGICLNKSGGAVATAPLQWFPASPKNVGWKLLSEAGVDVGSLSSVAARNRKPLTGEDTEIFYHMLAAAADMKDHREAPKPIHAVDLLRDPIAYTGEWISLEVETIQITRIAVVEPTRQQQLGSDHYYQIDAIGDLGNIVVEIAPTKDSGGKPATFENRYPVSLVCKTLPAWLEERIEQQAGTDSIVTPLTVPVTIDGFFYRLWSYSSEYMRQFGGGDQFGPLVIVANVTNREPSDADIVGVRRIGWIAAFAMGLGIFALLLWSFIVARRDRAVAQRRHQREAEQLEFPDESL
ncbi:hypothetical protein Q31b_38280 [Novipirellula aureliae]|uniref:Uncharacterized protein n=2 Tax=Novipirellula aureliae TaxID=2527966 RepID=A0A5C6DPL0_9BACT|nr:hypothetical protein Q31b_38280 [Novipirellula aureliae]